MVGIGISALSDDAHFISGFRRRYAVRAATYDIRICSRLLVEGTVGDTCGEKAEEAGPKIAGRAGYKRHVA